MQWNGFTPVDLPALRQAQDRWQVSRRGFTLVELLVVITIIALLAVIVVPSVSSGIHTARLVKCASNLHHVGIALDAAVGTPDTAGSVTLRQYPIPEEWPLVPYRMVPTPGIYVCPEDIVEDREGAVPGLIYSSMWEGPRVEIPFKDGKFCRARRGEDADGGYWEFVVEENTGYYHVHGRDYFGADFWDTRSWYPNGPDYSDNDGLFRMYDPKNGMRKFKLVYCTCTLDNQLYYYGKRIWYPLTEHVGSEMYLTDVYTSYGMNSALPKVGAAADTIVVLDYPERIAEYSDAILDKTQIAKNLDAVSGRHRGKVNVLFADKSVRTLGVTEAKPTMNPDPWSP